MSCHAGSVRQQPQACESQSPAPHAPSLLFAAGAMTAWCLGRRGSGRTGGGQGRGRCPGSARGRSRTAPSPAWLRPTWPPAPGKSWQTTLQTPGPSPRSCSARCRVGRGLLAGGWEGWGRGGALEGTRAAPELGDAPSSVLAGVCMAVAHRHGTTLPTHPPPDHELQGSPASAAAAAAAAGRCSRPAPSLPALRPAPLAPAPL